MLLIAVVKSPPDPEARAAVAPVLGLSLVDVNQRLAGKLPRVLLTESSPERAQAHVAALEASGFVVVTLDPAVVASDDHRVVARRLEFTGDGAVAFDRGGMGHVFPARAIALMQRGVRRTETTRTTTSSERHIDVKKAILTGGLLLTKKVDKTTVKTSETEDGFVLLERNDGGADIMLYEKQLDHRALGAEMAASSRANFERTWSKLKALVPAPPVDERVGAPGFVLGLPSTAADPIDLALTLVTLARRRGH